MLRNSAKSSYETEYFHEDIINIIRGKVSKRNSEHGKLYRYQTEKENDHKAQKNAQNFEEHQSRGWRSPN